MKKSNWVLLPLVTTLSSTAIAASTNTITFQGEVTDQTCTVAVNGEDANPIVLLPTVSKADLTTSGDVTGATDFNISVSGCTADASGVSISTVFVGNQVTTAGNLGNTGTASNVELQIVDTTSAPINFNNVFEGSDDLALAASETEKTATYKAQYYSTGTTTAGTVSASLQYAISYQ